MKIYPRFIEIIEGVDKYVVKISNSSEDDTILLFQIKRSEVKVVSFTPKKGFVEPNTTQEIVISVTNSNFNRARLQVKLAAIRRADIVEDFNECFVIGENYSGMVKKLIDIHNNHFNGSVSGSVTGSLSRKQKQPNSVSSNTSSFMHKEEKVREFAPQYPSQQHTRTNSLSTAEELKHKLLQQSSDLMSEVSYSAHNSPSRKQNPNQSQGQQGQMTRSTLQQQQHQQQMMNLDDSLSVFTSPHSPSAFTNRTNSYDYANPELNSSQIDFHNFRDEMNHNNNSISNRNITLTSLTIDNDDQSVLSSLQGSPTAYEQTRNTVAVALKTSQQKSAVATTKQTSPNMRQLMAGINEHSLDTQQQTRHPQQTHHQVHQDQSQHDQQQQQQAAQLNHSFDSYSSSIQSNLLSKLHSTSTGGGHNTLSSATAVLVDNEHGSAVPVTITDIANLIAQEVAAAMQSTAASQQEQALAASHEQQQQAYLRKLVEETSRLIRVSDANLAIANAQQQQQQSENCFVLELFSDQLNVSNIASVVEARLHQAYSGQNGGSIRIVALQFTSIHTNLTTTSPFIGHIFESTGISSTEAGNNDVQVQLNNIMRQVFADHLSTLTITHCPALQTIQSSVFNTNYNNITTLNLSRNSIRSIDSLLELPNLRCLDVSYNHLKSLDYLQCLLKLRVLNVSHNRISSLLLSIHMLVSLSDNLSHLDLSGNPVASDVRYIQEVINVLPRLRYFDFVDMAAAVRGNASTVSGDNKRSMNTARMSPAQREFAAKIRRILSQKSHQNSAYNTGIHRGSPIHGSPPHNNGTDDEDDNDDGYYDHAYLNSVQRNTVDSGDFDEDNESLEGIAYQRDLSHYRNDHQQQQQQHLTTPQMQPQRQQYPLQQVSTAVQNRQPFSTSAPVVTASSYPTPQQSAMKPNQNKLNTSQIKSSTLQSNTMANTTTPMSPMQQYPIHIPHQQQSQQQSQKRQPSPAAARPRPSPAGSPAVKIGGTVPAFAQKTAASKGRRKSQAVSLIPHWSGGSTQGVIDPDLSNTSWEKYGSFQLNSPGGVSGPKRSTSPERPPAVSPGKNRLLEPTAGIKQRRKSFGIAPTAAYEEANDVSLAAAAGAASMGYGSEGDTGMSPYRGVSQSAGAFDFSSNGGGGFNNNDTSRGYHSEGDLAGSIGGRRASFRGAASMSLVSAHFEEMQEQERYGIFHPRYRVPKPIFGFSVPFSQRKPPKLKKHPPLFEKYVRRMRDGFEKLPTRGTFTRASKGLTAEWYPMDYSDLEAIRRQGFFHQTIGDRQQYTYRDFEKHEAEMAEQMVMSQSMSSLPPNFNDTVTSSNTLQNTAVSASGSVTLSPTKKGRRGSVGQHQSRQYKDEDPFSNFRTQSISGSGPSTSVTHLANSTASDSYAGFRKWYASGSVPEVSITPSGAGKISTRRGSVNFVEPHLLGEYNKALNAANGGGYGGGGGGNNDDDSAVWPVREEDYSEYKSSGGHGGQGPASQAVEYDNKRPLRGMSIGLQPLDDTPTSAATTTGSGAVNSTPFASSAPAAVKQPTPSAISQLFNIVDQYQKSGHSNDISAISVSSNNTSSTNTGANAERRNIRRGSSVTFLEPSTNNSTSFDTNQTGVTGGGGLRLDHIGGGEEEFLEEWQKKAMDHYKTSPYGATYGLESSHSGSNTPIGGSFTADAGAGAAAVGGSAFAATDPNIIQSIIKNNSNSRNSNTNSSVNNGPTNPQGLKQEWEEKTQNHAKLAHSQSHYNNFYNTKSEQNLAEVYAASAATNQREQGEFGVGQQQQTDHQQQQQMGEEEKKLTSYLSWLEETHSV